MKLETRIKLEEVVLDLGNFTPLGVWLNELFPFSEDWEPVEMSEWVLLELKELLDQLNQENFKELFPVCDNGDDGEQSYVDGSYWNNVRTLKFWVNKMLESDILQTKKLMVWFS